MKILSFTHTDTEGDILKKVSTVLTHTMQVDVVQNNSVGKKQQNILMSGLENQGMVGDHFIIKAPFYSPMWIIADGSHYIFQEQRKTLLSTMV